jgi:uncharacterized protein
MMLMIPKGYENSAPGTMPDARAVEAMMKYNESLQKAGVLNSLEGLHPPSMGVRVTFSKGSPTVMEGPFVDAKEAVGGFWMIQVDSRDEAIEWAKRCPASDNEIIEIRQVQEIDDFPAEIQQIASGLTKMQAEQKAARGRLMNPVVHFEMPYENRERVVKFYGSSFGWQMQMLGEDMGNYVLATTTETDQNRPKKPGEINGGFFPKKPDWPAQYPSVVIGVENIEESVKKVIDAGGEILGEPMKIPGIGQYVSFIDTEGNRVGILQPIPRNGHAPKAE